MHCRGKGLEPFLFMGKGNIFLGVSFFLLRFLSFFFSEWRSTGITNLMHDKINWGLIALSPDSIFFIDLLL